MTAKEIHLRDYIRIAPDKSLKDMDDVQTVMFKDSATGKNRKGLLVTFDLSYSGRKINNRVYPPWGQKEGADSWTNPFPRPIITNHDASKDPIGRFVSVKWQSLEQEAINHLGDVRAYLEVKRALDSRDAQQVYKAFNKYGLFQDKNWPGVGKLVAQALISDKDAIEKFMDGRYLTFSAGSHTNAYDCMVCGSSWHTGDICDHRPGMQDEDGNTAFFMTGMFMGDEGSVVNMPGEVLSQVRNLELQDFATTFADGAWANLDSDTETFVFTDSKIEVARMSIEDLMDLERETVVAGLKDKSLGVDLRQLIPTTPEQQTWLSDIKAAMGEATQTVTTTDSQQDELENRFNKLKDEIMSAVNNTLADHTSASETEEKDNAANTDTGTELQDSSESGVQQSEEEAKQQDSQEKEESESLVDSEEPSLEDKLQQILDGEGDDAAKVAELKGLLTPQDDDDAPEFVDDASIDWFLLDVALNASVGDAKLSDEARKELPDSAFCGPDRSFPAHDEAHVAAARDLIGKSKLSDEQKSKLLACVDRKAKACTADTKDCKCGEFETLNADYVQALQTIDTLKDQLGKVLEAHATKLEVELSDAESGTRLDSLVTWFGTIDTTEQTTESKTVDHIRPVEDPSIDSSEGKQPSQALDSFSRNLIENYKQIRDTKSQEEADMWLLRNRKYLSPTLDLTKFIN